VAWIISLFSPLLSLLFFFFSLGEYSQATGHPLLAEFFPSPALPPTPSRPGWGMGIGREKTKKTFFLPSFLFPSFPPPPCPFFLVYPNIGIFYLMKESESGSIVPSIGFDFFGGYRAVSFPFPFPSSGNKRNVHRGDGHVSSGLRFVAVPFPLSSPTAPLGDKLSQSSPMKAISSVNINRLLSSPPPPSFVPFAGHFQACLKKGARAASWWSAPLLIFWPGRILSGNACRRSFFFFLCIFDRCAGV